MRVENIDMNVTLDVNTFSNYVLHIHKDELLEKVESEGKVLQKNKGDILIRPEDTSDFIVFLVSGTARGFFIDEEGKEFTFRFSFKSGDLLTDGSISLADHSYYWEALEKSEFLYIPKSLVREILVSDKDFQKYLANLYMDYYSKETALRYALMTMQSRERYLWFRNAFPDFPNKIPQKYIATYLNMLPQTLSQVRHDLKMESLI